jgi:HD-GYP domain-containing protein (c-di-GMP phosphodiesterase class II)
MTNQKLRRIPIDYLYAGLMVTEDIYNGRGDMIMIRAGTAVTKIMIERLIQNSVDGLMFVTQEMFRQMEEHKTGKSVEANPDKMVTKNIKVEKETGYTDSVGVSEAVYESIKDDKKVAQEDVKETCNNIAYRIKEVPVNILFDMINALAPVDEYLERHVVNVSTLNGLFAKWLKLGPNELKDLVTIGLMHDCGKAIIPGKILHAPRKLTTIEFEVMKMHTVFGYKIMTDFPEHIRSGVIHHHEKFNGAGYPNKVKGTRIHLYSRITAVSDVYDALVSKRCYKDPVTPFTVMRMLIDMRGKDLDTQLVNLFIEKMPDELVGRPVLMSNGQTGTVVSIDRNNIEYPVVDIEGVIVQTDTKLYCKSISATD